MTKTCPHTFGDLHFKETEGSELAYTAMIENHRVEEARACIKITCDSLCDETIETINHILGRLERMHHAAKQAYIDDFNNKEEHIYILNIYKKILTETEFTLLIQQDRIEQLLLFAVNLASVDIDLREENISIVFTYIKGYELAHKYKFNQDCAHIELIVHAGPCIMKEHLSTLIDIRELPLLNEICSRFRKDWQNYPLKSYFIYLTARRIKNYLKTCR